jgi:uncharacterized protein with HEPN domain
MDHDDAVTLEQIRQAGQSIGRFLTNVSEEAFLANEEKQSAVQHQILIIGEAATRLSQTFRNQHTSIPWTSIIGMRNRLIHGYDTVLLERVWQVASQDVPALLAYITPLVPLDEASP